MEIIQAFKFKLRANESHASKLCRMSGSCRFVWNRMLQWCKARLKRKQKLPSWQDMANRLPLLKRWLPWLSEDPYSHSLQHVCKRLREAYDRMFKKLGGEPRFKKKFQSVSMRFPEGLSVSGNKVQIPKIGWVRFHKSREIVGKVKNATIANNCGSWFVSLQTVREEEIPFHSGDAVGIDVGVSNFSVLSNGTFVAPLNSFKRHQDRLALEQQKLSRKVRFSSNWQKQKRVIGKLHSRIANVRRDFLHKLSTTISNNHAIVCAEDLKISNMVRSAKGTVENPGKNVKQKSGLNRAILDQGWGMFVEMLKYKLKWKGGQLVAVPPEYTSQTCPECGHVSIENRKTQAEFCCVACDFKSHADLVGATNVLRAGLSLCGVS